MDRILVTGLAGFVGRHFLEFLDKNAIPVEILGLDVNGDAADGLYKNIRCAFAAVDLLDAEETRSRIGQFQPSFILHLAASSSVGYSWRNPAAGFRDNINVFFNILEAVRLLKLPARILAIGSADGYGHVPPESLPIRETQPLAPVSPYAAARVSQEHLAGVYQRGYGLDIVMTRSFNHIGPGQRDVFAVPGFVKQMVGMKNRPTPGSKLVVGDISVVRDFLDVRDVALAYYQLLKKGRAGEVYNVCSGRGYALTDIIAMLARRLGIEPAIEVDEALIRPDDNKAIIGSNDKLVKETGWRAEYEIEKTLDDIIEEWMGKDTAPGRSGTNG